MSNVISLPGRGRDGEDRHPAVARLIGIQEALDKLDAINLCGLADASRTLNALDVANKCIRIVLNDFRDVPATKDLIEQSAALNARIARTSVKVAVMRPCSV